MKHEGDKKNALPQIDHGIPLAEVIDRLGATTGQAESDQDRADGPLLTGRCLPGPMDVDTAAVAVRQEGTDDGNMGATAKPGTVTGEAIQHETMDVDAPTEPVAQDGVEQGHTPGASLLATPQSIQLGDSTDMNIGPDDTSAIEPPGVYCTMAGGTPQTSPYFTCTM